MVDEVWQWRRAPGMHRRVGQSALAKRVRLGVRLALALMVAAGCGPTNTPGSPDGGNPDGGGTGGQAPTVSTSGDVAIVSGSAGGDVALQLAKGPRLVVIKSADGKVQLKANGQGGFGYDGASPGADGKYVQSFITTVSWLGTYTVSDVGGAFSITWSKLPTGTPVTAPRTFTGAGQNVVGPITLKAGTAPVRVKCTNTWQAGLNATIVDGQTGENVITTSPYQLVLSLENAVDVSATASIPADGAYYFTVSANGGANWEVDVGAQ